MNDVRIDQNYIITSILYIKNKKFNENFVTLKECSTINYLIKEKLKKEHININILSNINNEHFKIIDNVIFINKEKTNLEELINIYSNISCIKIKNTIWCENDIFINLLDVNRFRKEMLEELYDLKKIIDRLKSDYTDEVKYLLEQKLLEELDKITNNNNFEINNHNVKTINKNN